MPPHHPPQPLPHGAELPSPAQGGILHEFPWEMPYVFIRHPNAPDTFVTK